MISSMIPHSLHSAPKSPADLAMRGFVQQFDDNKDDQQQKHVLRSEKCLHGGKAARIS
ncbi:MAG: hypothetical protein R3C49_21675 [Planctomycetaceae bacterium]